MTGLVLALAFILFAIGFLGWKSLQLWRGDEAVRRKLEAATAVFPYGAAVRRGMVRATCLLVVQLVFIGATATSAALAMNTWHGGSKFAGWGLVALACLTVTIIMFLMQFSVVFFNSPSFVVPPALRQERGAWQREAPGDRPARKPKP